MKINKITFSQIKLAWHIQQMTSAYIHAEQHIIKKLADEGMAIIFISSDLPEVIAMSDRILVMREGRQMGIVESNNFTQETIMSLAMGEKIGDS